MWKFFAVTLILVLATVSIILGVRLQSQGAEYEKALAHLGSLTHEHEVLATVVDASGLRRDSVVAVLERRFPDEEIVHRNESIEIKNTHLSFLGSDEDVGHIHTAYRYWACGPVFGCTSDWDSIASSQERLLDRILFLMSRHGVLLVMLAFGGGVVYLGRRWSALNRRQRFDRARMLSSGLFVLAVVVLLATGKEAVDEMYEYGASPVLVAEAWRYAAQNFLVSVLAAAILWIAPRIVDRTTR